jgi:hypothetical protein
MFLILGMARLDVEEKRRQLTKEVLRMEEEGGKRL